MAPTRIAARAGWTLRRSTNAATSAVVSPASAPVVSAANWVEVNAPNAALQPEYHTVYQTRLAYYFGGRSPGQLSVAFIQDEATNFIASQTYHGGAALGVTDPQYDGYDFISTRNDPGVHRYRNMD